MEMQQIRYFIAVAKTLNFTQAAAVCHVTQPALSRAVKALEDELGGPLFRRERAHSHLTDLGRLMLPLLTQSYESAVAAKALATAYSKGVSQPLRLALSHSVNLAVLVPVLTELVKGFPGLELQFSRGNSTAVSENLKHGGVELAVAGPLGNDWDRFDAWPLFDEDYELVVHRTHPMASRYRVRLNEISGLRIIMRPYCEMADELAAALVRAGIVQRTGDQILSDQDVLSLIEGNIGAAIMPRSARTSDHLRGVAVDGLSLRRSVSVYAVAGRPRSGAAAGLLNLLRAADWPFLQSAMPSRQAG